MDSTGSVVCLLMWEVVIHMPFVHSSKNKGKGGKALQALQEQSAICTEGCQEALAASVGNASASPSAAQASYKVGLNAT